MRPIAAAGFELCTTTRSGNVVVLRLGDSAAAVLDPRDIATLELCKPPRTLAHHIETLAAAGLPDFDESRYRERLTQLERRGLLRAVADAPAAGPRGNPASRLRRVSIVTADRPALADRTLRSYVEATRHADEPISFLVVDASTSTSHATDTQRGVERVAEELGVSCRYCGARELDELTRRVARTLGADAAAWLFSPQHGFFSAGASRNAALLATAGTASLIVDDDTIASFRVRPERKEGVAMVGHGDCRYTEWYPTRSQSLNAGIPAPRTWSPLARHESLLGRSLTEVEGQYREQCDISLACHHLLNGLRGPRVKRVRLTWCGIAGDSAQYCPYWNLFATGPTRAGMLASADTFALALRGREVLRATLQDTISDDSDFMSYCAALDATELLPPFSPTGTYEDGLFAVMLRLCDPSAVIGQLAEAVAHDSRRPSTYEMGGPSSAKQPRLNQLIVLLLRRWAGFAGHLEGGERIVSLGRYLEELGRMPPQRFHDLVVQAVVEHKLRLLARIDATSGDRTLPAHWVAALNQFRAAVLANLQDTSLAMPAEWKERRTVSEAHRDLQRYLSRFGSVLAAWPQIWANAVVGNYDVVTSLNKG